MAVDEYVERAVRQDNNISRALMAMLGQAIRERSLLWVALLGALGLFVFTAIQPTLLRWGVTVSYCVTVLLPFLWRRT